MAVRPLHWQGKTRTEQLREHIDLSIREWANLWSIDPARLEYSVSPVPIDVPATRDDARWFSCEVAGGVLHLSSADELCGYLACELSGIYPYSKGELAEGVGQRALADLVRCIVQPTGEGKLSALTSTGMSEEGLRSCFGVLGFVLKIGHASFEIYLDSVLCRKLAPARSIAKTDLASRLDAVLPTQVTLSAVLELGRASLEETVMLKPGDVIKTNAPLSSLIQVGAESGSPLFSGVLAAKGNERALRCVDNFLDRGVKR